VPADPTLDRELALIAGAPLVIGCDEVGRGAIAGPVAVGVAAASPLLLDAALVPGGLRDSKLLSPARRETLAPLVRGWLPTAVGLASAAEVEERGILPALGLAAVRALHALHATGVGLAGAVVLLDGSHDWLSSALPARGSFSTDAPEPPSRVVVQAKADRDCATVAAASVVAKVHRDALMVRAHDDAPHYGWSSNKGYASAAHQAALAAHGAHPLHRASWVAGMLGAPSPAVGAVISPH